MKNRKTSFVDIDLKSYVLYYHKPSDSLMAFNTSETSRFHKLIGSFDGIENIPESEKVEGYILEYNATKNAYDIQHWMTREVKFNELDYVWVQYQYK